MTNLYKLAVAVIASMFIAGSAVAFQGVSIGLYGSDATFWTEGSETEGSGDSEKNTGKVTRAHEFPSAFVEYTHTWDRFGISFGVEHVPGDAILGQKVRDDGTVDANEDSQDDGEYFAKAKISDHDTFYIEPMFAINDNIGIYVKAGITSVTVTTLERIALGEDSSTYGDASVNGETIGIGIRGQHANGLGFKLEAIKTEYDNISLTSTTGNANTIKADPSMNAARIAIFYNF